MPTLPRRALPGPEQPGVPSCHGPVAPWNLHMERETFSSADTSTEGTHLPSEVRPSYKGCQAL